MVYVQQLLDGMEIVVVNLVVLKRYLGRKRSYVIDALHDYE